MAVAAAQPRERKVEEHVNGQWASALGSDDFLFVYCCPSFGRSLHFSASLLHGQPCVPVEENADDHVSFRHDSGHLRDSCKARGGVMVNRYYRKSWAEMGHLFLKDRSVHVLANGSAIFLCVNPGRILLSEHKRRWSVHN